VLPPEVPEMESLIAVGYISTSPVEGEIGLSSDLQPTQINSETKKR
jgi:hypothetical protein